MAGLPDPNLILRMEVRPRTIYIEPFLAHTPARGPKRAPFAGSASPSPLTIAAPGFVATSFRSCSDRE